jgi:hypothetical protein
MRVSGSRRPHSSRGRSRAADAHAFDFQPQSGNLINGVGETRRVRAQPVFHASGGERLAWKALDDFFSMINPWRVIRHVLFNTWQLRRSEGPVAAARREVPDPAALAAEIKALPAISERVLAVRRERLAARSGA